MPIQNLNSVIGWVDAWTSPYKTVPFTQDRAKALIERIRKRKYNFTYEMHQTLPYCAPFYADGVLCVLTKDQFDNVFKETYNDMPLGDLFSPQDAIQQDPFADILFEKEKFKREFEEKNHGRN